MQLRHRSRHVARNRLLLLKQGFLCFEGMKPAKGLNQEIGGRMRAVRVAVYGERSQGHVARLMNVSQSDLSRWECGKRVPSVIDLVHFARACGTSPEKVLSGLGPPPIEQLPLGDLDAKAAKTVRGLVVLLRERAATTRSRRAS